MFRSTILLLTLGLALSPAAADQVLLRIDDVPASGLVIAPVDWTAAANRAKTGPVDPRGILATTEDGQSVPLQFVPNADFDGLKNAAGRLVLRPPVGKKALRIRFERAAQATEPPWPGTIVTPYCSVQHDGKRQGGLPWQIRFKNKTFDALRWNNRLYHREKGSYCLADDPQATVERVSVGPICTVVRARARYVQGGKSAESDAAAVYDLYYFADQPLVFITAQLRQAKPFEWHEVHFLELNYPREQFPRWTGGEPLEQGEFKAAHTTRTFSQWGAVQNGNTLIGMTCAGQILLYDGGPGTYIQAHGDQAWQPWSETTKAIAGWLYWSDQEGAIAKLQQIKEPPAGGRVSVTTADLEARLAAARNARAPWQTAVAERLVRGGRFQEAVALLDGTDTSARFVPVSAGRLIAVLEQADGSLRLAELLDREAGQSFAADHPLPLFRIQLRNAESGEQTAVTADAGWEKVSRSGEAFVFERPVDKRLGDLHVELEARTSGQAILWSLAVQPAAPWSVCRAMFPQVAVADLGPRGAVFFPKAAGEVQGDAWRRPLRFTGTYPGGWTTMQYMAAYNDRGGLYVAVPDPLGSTKDLRVESRPSEHRVELAFDVPAEDLGRPGNKLKTTGQWQGFQGDWFDAAVIYRDWVRREARWYPKLGPDGRGDTPLWLRETSIWALGGGPPAGFLPQLKEFRQFFGPAAVHWYNWHQIPFDNDYPHYFPTHPGFAEAVRDAQAAGVEVMPYINGRLWDTRDKGAEDFEFTRVARPAVSKNEKQEPYTETYGSKEADGSPVRLGVMCPATELWQKKVQDTVRRLYQECGVRGVYIDQVAAASPTLCFDPTHGHPLGGGAWWTAGYWKMLQKIRDEKPADRILTTECNGEPFIYVFDGYLTWHWQYDGQVPAFPAVYGGAIQMFGRSYGGGPTRDLALRMRAAQQLVFGEQIGWINPSVLQEKENAEFLRQVVNLRRRLVRFFYAGEMARPPKPEGVPSVRADWQWNGVDWVTTDAVLTGAWHEPRAKRLVLVFVNVSDAPVASRLTYDLRPYGLGPAKVAVVTAAGPGETFDSAAVLDRQLRVPPRTAVAWLIGGTTTPGSASPAPANR